MIWLELFSILVALLACALGYAGGYRFGVKDTEQQWRTATGCTETRQREREIVVLSLMREMGDVIAVTQRRTVLSVDEQQMCSRLRSWQRMLRGL